MNPRRNSRLVATCAPIVSVLLTACLTSGGRTPPDAPQALLERAIEYAGGREALTRARVLTWEGEAVVHAGGRDVPIAGTWTILPPDTAVVSTYAAAAGPASTRSLVVAAPQGWTVANGQFTPMSASVLANERDEFYLYAILRLVPLLEPGVQLVAVAAAEDGAQGFGVRRAGRPDVDVFVDRSGRVVRLRTSVVHPMTGGRASQELRFEGAMESGGIRWPQVLRIVLDGAPYFDLTMRDLRTLDRMESPLVAGPR